MSLETHDLYAFVNDVLWVMGSQGEVFESGGLIFLAPKPVRTSFHLLLPLMASEFEASLPLLTLGIVYVTNTVVRLLSFHRFLIELLKPLFEHRLSVERRRRSMHVFVPLRQGTTVRSLTACRYPFGSD